MKLTQVTLMQTVAGATEFDGRRIALEYDPATDMVAIGVEGLEVPRSIVKSWRRYRANEAPQVKVRCPGCAREFNNSKALGGHMAQSGHRGAA